MKTIARLARRLTKRVTIVINGKVYVGKAVTLGPGGAVHVDGEPRGYAPDGKGPLLAKNGPWALYAEVTGRLDLRQNQRITFQP